MNKKQFYDKKVDLIKCFLDNDGNIDVLKFEQEKLNRLFKVNDKQDNMIEKQKEITKLK